LFRFYLSNWNFWNSTIFDAENLVSRFFTTNTNPTSAESAPPAIDKASITSANVVSQDPFLAIEKLQPDSARKLQSDPLGAESELKATVPDDWRRAESVAKVKKFEAEAQAARDLSKKLEAEGKKHDSEGKKHDAEGKKHDAEGKKHDSEGKTQFTKRSILAGASLGLVAIIIAGGYSVRFPLCISFDVHMSSNLPSFVLFVQFYVHEDSGHNAELVYKKIVCCIPCQLLLLLLFFVLILFVDLSFAGNGKV
jgi:hypothetical protein